MNYRQRIGQFGEMLAKKYLVKHGYKIIATNVKNSYQEIDIIAQKQLWFVFIEVKTRTSMNLGSADMAMTSQKVSHLKKAISNYIDINKIDENYIRLDLISVDIKRFEKVAKIKHYKDII